VDFGVNLVTVFLEYFEGIMAFQNGNEMVLRGGIAPLKKNGA